MSTDQLNKEELDIIAKALVREVKENGAFEYFKKGGRRSYIITCEEIRKRRDIYPTFVQMLWGPCNSVYFYRKSYNLPLRAKLHASVVLIKFLGRLLENKLLYRLSNDLYYCINSEFTYICYSLFPENDISRNACLSALKTIFGDEIVNNLKELYKKHKTIITVLNTIQCFE